MRKLKHLWQIALRYLRPGSSLSFWYLPVTYDPQFNAKGPGLYPVNFRHKTEYQGLDNNGIPVMDYGADIGRQYNACAISQYALGLHARYLDNPNSEAKALFLKQADWLKENQTESPAGIQGTWPLPFDMVGYRVKGPWISSLIQAQAISTLLRAQAITGDPSYRAAATLAFESIRTPMEQGGVTRFIHNHVVFEEAPSSPPSTVFDGFLYSFWGVYEYALATGSPEAESMIDRALAWLKDHIDEYDIGFWSRADVYRKSPPCPASRHYHQVHSFLLTAIGSTFDDNQLLSYAEKWAKQDANPIYRKSAMAYKIVYKLVFY
nr:D-glucuronyl C5-epimerase family protein [uncultured Pseudodesulfovibrio sp.]